MKKIYAKILLSDGSEEKIGYTKLLSAEINHLGVSDTKKPSYGIVLPSGRLEFKDENGVFLKKINDGLARNSKTLFYFENEDGETTNIGVFLADKWEYDDSQKKVKCALCSEFERLKNQNIESDLFKGGNVLSPMSISYIYDYIRDAVSINVLIEKEIRNFMENTKIQFPFIESNKSAWHHIEEICRVCGFYALVDYFDEREWLAFFKFE